MSTHKWINTNFSLNSSKLRFVKEVVSSFRHTQTFNVSVFHFLCDYSYNCDVNFLRILWCLHAFKVFRNLVNSYRISAHYVCSSCEVQFQTISLWLTLHKLGQGECTFYMNLKYWKPFLSIIIIIIINFYVVYNAYIFHGKRDTASIQHPKDARNNVKRLKIT